RVVRRRADELHAALVSLVVGLAADERRQEGVVDVDDAPREARHELAAQDLHVAREDDEIDLPRFDELGLALLLLGLVLLRDRDVDELHAELRRDVLEIRVVADHERDVAIELAGPMAQQEVVEAVVVARYEDRRALPAPRVEEPILHREALRDLTDG